MPVLSEDSGLHETLALLTSQLRPDSSHGEEMGFLQNVFSERSLRYLMKIHEKLRCYEQQSPTPVLHSAVALAEDVAEELQATSAHGAEKELLQLLATPHLRAMLMVHDTVAQKNFDPVLPPLPDNIDEDFEEESVKIVRLVKNKEPLGATIRRDEHTGAVVVARIMRGGAADRSGEWGCGGVADKVAVVPFCSKATRLLVPCPAWAAVPSPSQAPQQSPLEAPSLGMQGTLGTGPPSLPPPGHL